MSEHCRSCSSRPYEESDLNGLKKHELLALVKTQIERWPLRGKEKKLRQDKVTKRRLIEVLLNRRAGFTTTAPRRLSHASCASGGPRSAPQTGSAQNNEGSIFQALSLHQPPGALQTVGAILPTARQCEIRLRLQDHRHPREPMKTMEVIYSHAVNHPYFPEKWQVSASDVLQHLQKTNGRITGPGPVKVGVPDDREPEYTRYFIQAPVSELTSTHAVPDQLTVPASSTTDLTFRIDFAGMAGQSPMWPSTGSSVDKDDDSPEALLQHAALPDNFKPLECARDRARTRRKAKTDEADVEWLRNAASERFGHQHFRRFQRSRNRILQNPDIVTLWKFAVQLNDTYHKKKSGVSDNSISKSHIHAALNVGETWLRQAEEGHQLVQLYGEGGVCEAREVKDEIARRREPPLGSGKLLEFLHNWETSHPV